MENKTLIQDLKAVRRVVDAGWCRYNWTNERGQHCIMGAIGEVLRDSTASDRRTSLLKKLEDQLVGTLAAGRSIMYYNDEVAKDKRYILRLIDRTIKANS